MMHAALGSERSLLIGGRWEAAEQVIPLWKDQLRLAMFLTGASDLSAFAGKPGHVDAPAAR